MAAYDYLFRELHEEGPWTPPGDSEAECVRHVRDRASRLYGVSREGSFAAAYTFFGQFVTHDLTFDARTDLSDRTSPITNLRTPRFDLDCVYGDGPVAQPQLYLPSDPRKLAIGRNENGEPDLARKLDRPLDGSGSRATTLRPVALIGDPRNDDNTVVSQLHLAFIGFHNRLIEQGHDFADARRLTRLHYQWVLRHDYLAKLCTPALLDDFESGVAQRFLPRSGPAFVPFEFAFAAFRFGHSMVGPRYLLNDALADERIRPFGLCNFNAMDWPSRDANASTLLDGWRALPARWTVQWELFLCGDHPRAQRAQRIDLKLDGSLRYLPRAEDRDLAFRTLMRGLQLGLPSGQRIARHLGAPVIASDDASGDPLWIYVLREAEAEAEADDKKRAKAQAKPADAPHASAAKACSGNRLGPVGAHIVAEVCVRLLEADPESLLGEHRGWTPEAVAKGGSYTLREFLVDAGAPITRADWNRAVPDPGQSAT